MKNKNIHKEPYLFFHSYCSLTASFPFNLFLVSHHSRRRQRHISRTKSRYFFWWTLTFVHLKWFTRTVAEKQVGSVFSYETCMLFHCGIGLEQWERQLLVKHIQLHENWSSKVCSKRTHLVWGRELLKTPPISWTWPTKVYWLQNLSWYRNIQLARVSITR